MPRFRQRMDVRGPGVFQRGTRYANTVANAAACGPSVATVRNTRAVVGEVIQVLGKDGAPAVAMPVVTVASAE